MIKTIIGLILLLIPFLLIYRFKDKRAGFFYILSFLIAGILAVSLITQAFGIFGYYSILIILALIDLLLLTRINLKEFVKDLRLIKINWVFIAVLIILFISLYSVHYHYTGTISTVRGEQEVRGMKYSYPYFTDEWAGVSLIKYSIEYGKLPSVNPLGHNAPFPNFSLPFHTFSSGLVLLLGLDPLNNFAILPLLSGLLVCILVYFVLRVNNVNIYASAISSLSTLYLLNGAVMPGIWYYIPIILGGIFMLFSFIAMVQGSRKMMVFNSFLALVFYPPLFIFVLASIIPYFLFNETDRKTKTLYLASFLVVCAISGAFIFVAALISIKSLRTTIAYILNHLVYIPLINNAIPDFSITKIIPLFLITFAILGLLVSLSDIKKRLWMISPIALGLIFWFIYSKNVWRVIIEYDRIVFLTSILITLLAGFGMNYIFEYLKAKKVKKCELMKIIGIIAIAVFFILSFSYTSRDEWRELKLRSIIDEGVFLSEAPANMHLNQADLALFKDIKEKNFLSYPTKGLVIGVATGNYPLVSKGATITNVNLDLSNFLKENCANKLKIAKENEADYVYLKKIECEGFKLINISIEDLYLYEVEK